ncbi:hypothetical protein RCCS2_00232 [Roseobacter sp. CCS2]|nr:hypothetical protein RCCS2_00232 [Roseobacter sp. CCS2]
MAQQFNGATVSGAFQSLDDESVGEYEVTSFAGGVEFGISTDFAIGANAEIISSDDFEDDFFIGTVHGMYTAAPGTTFGVFYASETFDDFDTDILGIEGAFTTANSTFEGYLGAVDSDYFGDQDVLRMLGLSLEFGVGSGVSLGIEYESFRLEDGGVVVDTGEREDASLTDTALFARYSFAQGASVYAKAGRERLFGSDRDDNLRLVGVNSTEYVTVGAEFDFGAGTTFGSRSLFNFGG